MIALIDYDAGNIKSVEKAFQSLGKEVVLTRDPEVLKRNCSGPITIAFLFRHSQITSFCRVSAVLEMRWKI